MTGLPSARSVIAMAALCLLGAGLATGSAGGAVDPCAPLINPVACENSKPGTPKSTWDVSGAGTSTIQGFATNISVNRGQTVQFKIKTPATAYRLDVYRMGYYGGNGARLVATVAPSAALPQTQPACANHAATGLIDCSNWKVSASWAVPSTAVSGIYFAKLVRTDGTAGSSHVFFVVRNDASTSPLLFQTSDTTWEAYNAYGGNSLYTGSPAGRAYKVSYDRPFSTRGPTAEDWVFNAEYPMVRWLEANGYDVSYMAGVDTARSGALIKNHKVFMSVGHDEYWSGDQRANVEAARNAGVNLAFFSGNESFWKTRWESDDAGSAFRTLVTYKETHANAVIDPADPPVWTGSWRDPRFSPPADGGRPENALSGTIFMVNGSTSRADSIKVPAAFRSLRFWRNTSVASLAAGATKTMPAGTLGYEWDSDLDNGARPAGLIRLSSATYAITSDLLLDYGSTFGNGSVTHNLTLYRAPSGALVFGAGTVQWAWGLDADHDRAGAPVDPDMKQATVNLLADMGAQPGTLQAGLVAATASADKTAPTATIKAPVNGATATAGQAVTVSGTAADAGGGVVAGVEVSTDGGATWHPASGTTSWTYSWTPRSSGSTTLLARATDDSANLGARSAPVAVTVPGQTCPCSLWRNSPTPGVANDPDTSATELGVRFQSEASGFITGLRFYKGSQNAGTHVGHLWTAAGQLLASATFTGETASGWQTVTLSSPVAIAANTTYVASYSAPNGHYAADTNYFAAGPLDNSPLHAPQAANGVYVYGAGAFPNNTFQSTNYWVDVVFNRSAADTTPPTVSSRTPSAGATGVALTVKPTATFSEPVQGAAFALRSAQAVQATTSYDSATRTATLSPSAQLAASTTYTATVSGARDAAGNTMAPTSWTFTTGTGGSGCPCSIWAASATPAAAADSDTASVELGVKFRSDVAGSVTGIRFYKASTNTGTHTAALWSAAGTRLASATFSGESASGWQQVNFATPVAIQANTTYVASYHAPNGHYAADAGFFATAGVDRGPLHALRDGVDGGDGVYAYGSATAFPTNSFASSNYWVDVVLATP
jgi:Domain of unknown function (DUF4082)/Bacterial Ig-like domain/Bacterial Ig domain